MPGKFLRVFKNGAKGARPSRKRRSDFEKSNLEVRMFNVGGGEAILLIFPERRAWLVDGGSMRKIKELGKGLAAYLKTERLVLEALVLSHPHEDHGAAITALLSEKPDLTPTVTYYYSDDPLFHAGRVWLGLLSKELNKLGHSLKKQVIGKDGHREVEIADGAEAHLFTGGKTNRGYRSIFLHLHFGDARLLFTGDAYSPYEVRMLDRLGEGDFRADVLKVTHHGSSDGTAKKVVAAVKPGIAIASTADDEGHRLETATLNRLGGHDGPREIYETLTRGDIILRTDGGAYGNGVLYQVEFKPQGEFAAVLGLETA